MKNRYLSFGFVLLSVTMIPSGYALADTPTATDAKVKKTKKCLFPNSKKRAPDWVCNAHADGLAIAAVGSATKSEAGISFMEQMATADARTHLAQSLRGSGQKKNAASDSTSTTTITNESLQDTKVMKSVYGPDGTLYVLVGLDEASVQKLR